MHLLPRMNVMLDFIWTLPVQLRGTRNQWPLQKILSTVGFDPPTPHGLQISSPPLSPLDQNLLDVRWNWMSVKFISIRSINKLEKVHAYIASTICRFQPYNVWILLNTVIKYLHWSICKTIQMLYHVTAATEIHMYTMLTLCTCTSSHVYL